MSQHSLKNPTRSDILEDTIYTQKPTRDFLNNFTKTELQKHAGNSVLTKAGLTKYKLIEMILDTNSPPLQPHHTTVPDVPHPAPTQQPGSSSPSHTTLPCLTCPARHRPNRLAHRRPSHTTPPCLTSPVPHPPNRLAHPRPSHTTPPCLTCLIQHPPNRVAYCRPSHTKPHRRVHLHPNLCTPPCLNSLLSSQAETANIQNNTTVLSTMAVDLEKTNNIRKKKYGDLFT